MFLQRLLVLLFAEQFDALDAARVIPRQHGVAEAAANISTDRIPAKADSVGVAERCATWADFDTVLVAPAVDQ
jgi:hypothetical protein